MSPNQPLPLVTICDNRFALLLAALVKSIEINLTAPAQFDLYLVNDGIDSANREKLLQSINPEVFNVHWLTIDEAIPVGMALPIDQSTFPLNVYIRLFIPFFIPQHLTRVVYMDVDMIAHQDITALWKVDLGNKLLGAVRDRAEVISSSWGGYQNYRELGLHPETPIFNSGLLVIDPIRWRQQHITERVLTCLAQNAKYAVFADQYGLNVVLANQWLELDRAWNTYAQNDIADPYVIHFTGIKPIYRSYTFNKAYQEEFFLYLNQTAWRGYAPVSGWRHVLLKQIRKVGKRLYHLVNQLNPFKRNTEKKRQVVLSMNGLDKLDAAITD
ncbi:glycosyltransferase family 8 protein [Spirosoma aerolatum]|uniref:glycosyltransferase family 8 protein n=1 Tax=Spirosoma aerolatum TaxID=1211326 RepID=UPI0009ACA8BD|nr:glycosyltransferase family 8 protein [Spirosoma aerolatum]